MLLHTQREYIQDPSQLGRRVWNQLLCSSNGDHSFLPLIIMSWSQVQNGSQNTNVQPKSTL